MLLLPLFVFLLGLIVGSFFNVVILRLNTGRSIATGRSMCPRCSKTLSWYELVPVVSFLALRGKCRACKLPISFQYPVVELVSAIVFLILYMKIPLAGGFTAFSWLSFLFSLIVASLLIVIAVYDARHKIIPDVVLYPFLLLSLLAIGVKATLLPNFMPLQAIVSGVVVGLPFFLLWLFSKGRVMGFGDVKLSLGMGWLLGMSTGFAAIIIAFWIGAIFGLFVIALSYGRASMKSQIPFGPFLIAGTFIAGVWAITFQSIFPLWL